MKKQNESTDRELIEEFKSGNNESFGVLIDRYSKHISFTIFKYFKNPDQIKDIHQDAFMKAMVAIRDEKYKEEGTFQSWMTNLTKNFCIDILRKEKRYKDLSIDNEGFQSQENFIDKDPNPEETLITKESSKNLHELVENLPSNQRDVVIMRSFWGMSFGDISKYLGGDEPVNINTCLGRMRYAVKRLRKNKDEI